MTIRVGINGFGRIGRLVFRVMDARDSIEVVAVNDLADAHSLAMLLKYDSVHGTFPGTVEAADDDTILVNGKELKVLTERNPAALPWKELGVDFVVESTGIFRKRDQIAMHLEAGAPKVLLTVPAMSQLWTRHDEVNEHHRRYNRRGLARVLEAAGYQPLELRYMFSWMVVPKLAVRAKEALFPPEGVPRSTEIPWAPLNRLALGISRAEHRLARMISPPVGSSLLAWARA